MLLPRQRSKLARGAKDEEQSLAGSVVSRWQCEPKWQVSACLIERDGKTVTLTSKSGHLTLNEVQINSGIAPAMAVPLLTMYNATCPCQHRSVSRERTRRRTLQSRTSWLTGTVAHLHW